MPRPKTPKGCPIIYALPFKLSGKEKIRLVRDILGNDMQKNADKKAAEQVAKNIEYWIGAYFEYKKNNNPTDAAIKKELSSARMEAIKLNKTLISLSGWASERLNKSDYNKYKLARELAKFSDITINIIDDLSKNSRGQPKNKALRILVNHLYNQFQKSYSAPDNYADDDPTGTKAQIAMQNSLKCFITECLDFAKIKHPKDISSLLYTDKTPSSERLFFKQIP